MGFAYDILLIGLPLGLAILGVSRGIQREAMTLIGILLGGLLAEIWGPIWGPANAARFNQDVHVTQALISVALLLFSTIFIGYGGALLLPSRRQLAQGRSRLFGGIAGSFNGLLILGLLMRYANLRVGSGMASPLIAQTRVGPLLVERMPMILFLSMLAGAVVVVVRLIQRLLFKLHGKPAAAPAKPGAAKPGTAAAKPGAAKPGTAAAKPGAAGSGTAAAKPAAAPAPKPPPPDSTNNPILRDLLLLEEKKTKQS